MSDADSAQTPPVDPKVIKRYTNRKLYDTVESRYVTLEEIAEMVKSGTEVKIVDNRTKEDLTSVTLAQIIFEEEKKTSKMPLGMLRDIIRTGGNSVQQFFQKEITSRVQDIKEGAEHLRERLPFFKKEDGQPDPNAPEGQVAPAPAPAPAPVEEAHPAEGKDAKEKAKLNPKELVALSQKTVENWQRVVDERIKAVVESMTSLPALAKDMAALQKQLDELEGKLKSLEEKEK